MKLDQFRCVSTATRWALVSALLLTVAKGTSIAIVVQPSVITVAADSAEFRLDRSGGRSVPVCKVDVVNRVLILLAGLAGDADRNFDPLGIARAASSTKGGVTAVMDQFKDSAMKALPAEIDDAKGRNSSMYQDWKAGGPILEIFMGTVGAGGAVKRAQCIFLLSGDQVKPDCPVLGTDGKTLTMGTHQSLLSPLKASPLQFVRSAVDNEIAASQRLGDGRVGPPITTATFDAKGIHYVEPGKCPDPASGKQK